MLKLLEGCDTSYTPPSFVHTAYDIQIMNVIYFLNFTYQLGDYNLSNRQFLILNEISHPWQFFLVNFDNIPHIIHSCLSSITSFLRKAVTIAIVRPMESFVHVVANNRLICTTAWWLSVIPIKVIDRKSKPLWPIEKKQYY